MRHGWLSAVLVAVAILSLSACQSPLGRELTPASVADLDRVEAKVGAIPKAQYDAYLKAKAAGAEVGAAVEAAFVAGAERGEEQANPEGGSFLSTLLEILAVVLGGGTAGTLLTRILRGAPLASGSGAEVAAKKAAKKATK